MVWFEFDAPHEPGGAPLVSSKKMPNIIGRDEKELPLGFQTHLRLDEVYVNNSSNFVKLNLRDDFSVGKSFHVVFLVCDVSLGEQ